MDTVVIEKPSQDTLYGILQTVDVLYCTGEITLHASNVTSPKADIAEYIESCRRNGVRPFLAETMRYDPGRKIFIPLASFEIPPQLEEEVTGDGIITPLRGKPYRLWVDLNFTPGGGKRTEVLQQKLLPVLQRDGYEITKIHTTLTADDRGSCRVYFHGGDVTITPENSNKELLEWFAQFQDS